MATLAIKGNQPRHEDIKQLFRDLGASEIIFECSDENYLYYISHDKIVFKIQDLPNNIYRNLLFKVYTIEEFEAQFPFRVGDMVGCGVFVGQGEPECQTISRIKSMCWCYGLDEVCYITENDGKHFVRTLGKTFEPKEGDVVTVETIPSGKYVIVYSSTIGGEIYSKCGLNCQYGMTFRGVKVCTLGEIKSIRPATKEEKKKLFDKLAEEGLEWDAHTKELVKLKWKPELDEKYYHPILRLSNGSLFFEPMTELYGDDMFNNIVIKKGWAFRTKNECKVFCEKLNQAISQVKP